MWILTLAVIAAVASAVLWPALRRELEWRRVRREIERPGSRTTGPSGRSRQMNDAAGRDSGQSDRPTASAPGRTRELISI